MINRVVIEDVNEYVAEGYGLTEAIELTKLAQMVNHEIALGIYIEFLTGELTEMKKSQKKATKALEELVKLAKENV